MSRYDPMRPLDLSQVLGISFRLCRAQIWTYGGIALRSIAWGSLPFLGFLLVVSLVAGMRLVGSSPGAMVLAGMVLLLGWLGGVFYCAARSLLNNALISRLAFHSLIQQPESPAVAYGFLRPQLWNFLSAQILTGLFLLGINIGVAIATNILRLILLVVRDVVPLVDLAGVIVQYWFAARFFMPEVPLALEENLSGVDTVDRCWKLTGNQSFRILWILFVTWVFTALAYLVIFLPPLIFSLGILPRLSSATSREDWIEILPLLLPRIGPAIFFSLLLMAGLGVFVLLFWQVVKAVIYYTLRSQELGRDVKLKESPVPSFPSGAPGSLAASMNSAEPQSPPDIAPARSDLPKGRKSPQGESQVERVVQQLRQLEADFSRLEPEHWQAVEKYLQQRSGINPEAKKRISLQLAKGVKGVIGLQQLPQKMTPDLFLEAVYSFHPDRSQE